MYGYRLLLATMMLALGSPCASQANPNGYTARGFGSSRGPRSTPSGPSGYSAPGFGGPARPPVSRPAPARRSPPTAAFPPPSAGRKRRRGPRRGRGRGYGYGYGYGYPYPPGYHGGWVAPSYLYNGPYAVPPPNGYVPLPRSNGFEQARAAGVNALEKGDFARALAQLRKARDRATMLWGAASTQATEAAKLLWQTEYELWLRGGGRQRGSYPRALENADRALGTGNLYLAEIGYHDALLRASNGDEAKAARERLATVRALRRGGVAPSE